MIGVDHVGLKDDGAGRAVRKIPKRPVLAVSRHLLGILP
jgi:hypothetical protein